MPTENKAACSIDTTPYKQEVDGSIPSPPTTDQQLTGNSRPPALEKPPVKSSKSLNSGRDLVGNPLTGADLYCIFQSGGAYDIRGLPADFESLAAELNAGRIQMEVCELPRLGVRGLPAEAMGGGSLQHSALKATAAQWLHSEGSMDVRYEYGWSHGRADVVGVDLGIVFECGNTSPLNVAFCLRDGQTNQFIVLPYDTKCAFSFIHPLPASRTPEPAA
jgi:hypothetical protein